tara:strand:- start:1037 stop:2002 length:966 start_codon:yes stop_codon:yes gene_type:complete
MLNLKKIKNEASIFMFWISKINIKLLITIICLAFIGTSIYGNFEALVNQEITIQEIIWLFFGIIFSFLSIIINAYAWRLLVDNIGCKSNNLNIVKLFLATNIYKYLPGGIWHFVCRYKKLRLEFSTNKSIESILLEPLLMLVAGFIFIPFGSLNISLFILCWSSTLVFLPIFRQLLIKILKGMKSNIFTSNDQLKELNSVQNSDDISRNMIYPYKPLFVEILFILFRFFGFLCCMNAFSIGSLSSQGELISSFSLAWTIGLIVPAAPGGLGVFESVILFRLGSYLPEAPLLAALLFYRLVSTISDIFAALIYPIKKFLKFE